MSAQGPLRRQRAITTTVDLINTDKGARVIGVKRIGLIQKI